MQFGSYISHFGGHIGYANEPNLHNLLRDPHKDTYTNLRLVQSELLTVHSKMGTSEAISTILAAILNMQMSRNLINLRNTLAEDSVKK